LFALLIGSDCGGFEVVGVAIESPRLVAEIVDREMYGSLSRCEILSAFVGAGSGPGVNGCVRL